jgi:ArsR family transcriptional regulator
MINTNVSSNLAKVSELLQAISPEPRLQIMLAIGTGEACVCHLEAVLGYRQAYISQQLMALREAGLLTTRRDGKFIFYRLENPEIIDAVKLVGKLAGLASSALAADKRTQQSVCGCPVCSTMLAAI